MVDFQIAQKCAENYPGIEKIKIPTFFAFTGLIYLQILQIGFRSIINYSYMFKAFYTLNISSIICIFELNFKTILIFNLHTVRYSTMVITFNSEAILRLFLHTYPTK